MGRTAEWEFVSVQPMSGIPLRTNFLCAPVSNHEMLVLGGMNNDDILGDGYLFNSDTLKVTNPRRNDIKLDVPGNQWAWTKSNQIVALTIDPRKKLRLISYTSGAPKTEFVGDLGSAEE